MLINVSTLLTEPVGRARRYDVACEPVTIDGVAQAVSGDVNLIRSERGIVVMAALDLEPVSQQCARCLEPFDLPVHVEFDEEFVLDRDPQTGERINSEPDDFHIDARRHLDLSEAVRQYGESVLPIQPLCREDCRGLCPECGLNLNEGACGHSGARIDHRWSGLAGLAEQLRTEDSDGRPEA